MHAVCQKSISSGHIKRFRRRGRMLAMVLSRVISGPTRGMLTKRLYLSWLKVPQSGEPSGEWALCMDHANLDICFVIEHGCWWI